jgi:hypothetical protein
MRARYNFQVAQMMSAQPLPSFSSSGVNLDKCLVQDLSQMESLMPVDEKYKSEQGSCRAIQNEKNESKSSGHLIAY